MPSTSACRSGSTRDGKPALGERFRIGDRLIQTRNAHDLGLMNGSIVFLREDDPDGKCSTSMSTKAAR